MHQSGEDFQQCLQAIVNLINCFKVYHRLAVPEKYRRVLPVCSGVNFSHKSFSKILLTQVIGFELAAEKNKPKRILTKSVTKKWDLLTLN